jgi:hypothetical protein
MGLEKEWVNGSNGTFEIYPNQSKTTKNYAEN